MGVGLHLARGLALRCPACGRGRIYRALFDAHEACPACARPYARDRGDWTGGAEIVLLLTIPFAAAVTVAVGRSTELPMWAELLVVMGIVLAVMPFVYRHVKGFWVGLVMHWEGDDPRPSPVRDPQWFTDLWEKDRLEPPEPPPTWNVRLR